MPFAKTYQLRPIPPSNAQMDGEYSVWFKTIVEKDRQGLIIRELIPMVPRPILVIAQVLMHVYFTARNMI